MAIPIYSPGGGGITQTTTEFLNQSSVSISHNFSHKPRVIIVNSSGEVIMGDIQYYTNSITITFCTTVTGTVYLT